MAKFVRRKNRLESLFFLLSLLLLLGKEQGDAFSLRRGTGWSRTFKRTTIKGPSQNDNLNLMLPSHSVHVSASFALQAVRTEQEDEEDDDLNFVRVPRRRRRDSYYEENSEDRYYDEVDDEDDFTDGALFDEDDEDDDDLDDEEYDEDEDVWNFDSDNDMFENVLIPNPLLDSIDPDGAAERFPELARDPRFWFDMVLFIAFLNFLTAVGPQDPFPEIPIG